MTLTLCQVLPTAPTSQKPTLSTFPHVSYQSAALAHNSTCGTLSCGHQAVYACEPLGGSCPKRLRRQSAAAVWNHPEQRIRSTELLPVTDLHFGGVFGPCSDHHTEPLQVSMAKGFNC